MTATSNASRAAWAKTWATTFTSVAFFLPDALEAAERLDPDLFRFEMSEIDLHAGGAEGAHVGAMA